MSRVKICDTTLRDGEQMAGVHFGVSQKLDIAKRLAKTGVDVIEAGFPAASVGDFDAVRAVAEAMSAEGCPTVSALSRAVFADIDMTQTKIVVTKTNGKVELYNERGCYQRTIYHGNATQARWAGSDIAVYLSDHVELYSDRGCYIRRI